MVALATAVLTDPETLVVGVWEPCTPQLQSQSPNDKAHTVQLLQNAPMRIIVTLTGWVFLST